MPYNTRSLSLDIISMLTALTADSFAFAFSRGDKPWEDPHQDPKFFESQNLNQFWLVRCTLGPYIATHIIITLL